MPACGTERAGGARSCWSAAASLRPGIRSGRSEGRKKRSQCSKVRSVRAGPNRTEAHGFADILDLGASGQLPAPSGDLSRCASPEQPSMQEGGMRHVEGVLEGGVQGAIEVGAEHDASPAVTGGAGKLEGLAVGRPTRLGPDPDESVLLGGGIGTHLTIRRAPRRRAGRQARNGRTTGPTRRNASRGRRIRCIRPGESDRATRPGSDANSGPAGRGDGPSDRERPRAGSPSSPPRAAGGRARMTGRPDTSGGEEKPPDSRVGRRSQWIGRAPWSPSPR